MKTILPILLLLLSGTLSAQIEWISWEEAIERSKTEPRQLLVDVYTDWCGWCKRMDKTSFQDKAVVAYIKEHFYAVKLDAEQRETITYDGHQFDYDESVGRRGVHQLAVALLDGRMSYPSIVYLDAEQKRISISPGFKPAENLLREIQYIGGGHYTTTSFEDYLEASSK
ncbi:thioredoxin-related protein [Neolewinella xylanilytica]|uniref:Thioredoxin-related protein n=1 Tax=Neolewinella xylanilytica TaxID=1514080 RepID=A0A2S6I668_9BACT|nr:DUF255 domain-containing protein [Neolewinella xylanilytica]PPK86653.1 thioredoxin-related protein [Neolewinella xylanilytica]